MPATSSSTAARRPAGPVCSRLSAGGRRIRTIGPAVKETAVERGPAPNHRRCGRCPVLNDPSSLSVRHLRSATAERPFSESGTEGSNPVSSSGESGELPTNHLLAHSPLDRLLPRTEQRETHRRLGMVRVLSHAGPLNNGERGASYPCFSKAGEKHATIESSGALRFRPDILHSLAASRRRPSGVVFAS